MKMSTEVTKKVEDSNVQEGVTLEALHRHFPKRKNSIDESVVELINRSVNEPEFQGESLLQSALIYERVLDGTRASIREYLNAIRFCAYMVSMDDNYTEAYKKVFYDREFVIERMNAPTESGRYKELTSAASRYRKSKLVVDILRLSQVPMHLMFTGAKYEMLGVLLDTARTAKLDRDKINAAKEFLAAVKGPEEIDVELKVGPSQSAMDMQTSLSEQLHQLAINQKRMLEMGYSIQDVQKTGINLNVVEGEYEEA
jgi:hypothetical protein